MLRGALTSPGTRFTSTGDVVEDKELKQRPPDATREVPLAPDLVERLRWHMERWPPVDGHVFTNAAGRTPTATNHGPVWVRARTVLWPSGHRLGKTTVSTCAIPPQPRCCVRECLRPSSPAGSATRSTS